MHLYKCVPRWIFTCNLDEICKFGIEPNPDDYNLHDKDMFGSVSVLERKEHCYSCVGSLTYVLYILPARQSPGCHLGNCFINWTLFKINYDRESQTK